MIDFTFHNPTRIIFGRDALSHLPEECEPFGRHVLLVYGGGSVERSGLLDKVLAMLGGIGARVFELGGVQPNPRLSLVRQGIDICRRQTIGLVLAVGGGSVIDTGKAIVNGACYNGDPWDLFCGKGSNLMALPLGVILTIAAAGSEMSDSSVITRDEDMCKRGRSTPLNFPRFSLLDPTLTYTVSPYQTACGAVDIMAHMMERYFTRVEPVELTDRLIEGALKAVIHNAPLALQKPDDYDARAELMWAGAVAHNTWLQTGRVGDWASHKLEHELSALYDIAHGAGLAIIFPAWMKYVLGRGGEKKLAQFAARVWDVPDTGEEKAMAQEGIQRLEAFYHALGLKTTLHENGIGDADIPRMAERCASLVGGTVGTYVPLSTEDCRAIYEMAK